MILIEVAGIGLNLSPKWEFRFRIKFPKSTWQISAITSLQAVNQSRHPALEEWPQSLKRDRRRAEQDLRPGVGGDNVAGIDR